MRRNPNDNVVIVNVDAQYDEALRLHVGARRRRSGGGPGEGCARRPVGTYIYLHAVGAGNLVAVPCLAR
jgi:hypothetical protein